MLQKGNNDFLEVINLGKFRNKTIFFWNMLCEVRQEH